MGWFDALKALLSRPVDAAAERAEARIEIPASLGRRARTAWRAATQPGSGEPDGSRIGGLAWLPAHEAAPRCPACDSSLHLSLQLRADEIPRGGPGRAPSGWIQLFLCDACSGGLVRRTTGSGGRLDEARNGVPAQQITGWEAVDDLPGRVECEARGFTLSEAEHTAIEALERPLSAAKLGGWPTWQGSVAYPDCAACGAQTELVFQRLPIRIFGCVDHPDELVFAR